MKTAVTVVYVLLLVVFLYMYWKSNRPLIVRQYFTIGLCLKLLCGLAIGWLYSVYYITGDTFVYFNDAQILSDLAVANPKVFLRFLWSDEISGHTLELNLSEPRALFFVKFVSIINLLAFNNYWITTCWLSIISFTGAWSLWKRFAKYFSDVKAYAFIAFFLFPSVVFWSSGLIKESIALGGLFYLTALFLDAWFRSPIRYYDVALACLALWAVWGLKYYYAAVFVPVIVTSLVYRFVISQWLDQSKTVLNISAWFAVFFLLLVIASFTHPNFYPDRFLQVIASNHDVYRQYSAPEDMIDFGDVKPEFGNLLMKVPLALGSGLFRPFFFEATNVLQVLAGVENLALLILFVLSLKNLIPALQSRHRILLLAAIIYISVLCVFLTITTPNFGTLSRYRVGFLPFFVFIILCKNPLIEWLQSLWVRLVK